MLSPLASAAGAAPAMAPSVRGKVTPIPARGGTGHQNRHRAHAGGPGARTFGSGPMERRAVCGQSRETVVSLASRLRRIRKNSKIHAARLFLRATWIRPGGTPRRSRSRGRSQWGGLASERARSQERRAGSSSDRPLRGSIRSRLRAAARRAPPTFSQQTFSPARGLGGVRLPPNARTPPESVGLVPHLSPALLTRRASSRAECVTGRF